MAIRKRPDGNYVIRYYADGTKRSAQRQETLRGISYAEAVRIYKKKLAKAAARRGNAGASDRLTFQMLAEEYLNTHTPADVGGSARARGIRDEPQRPSVLRRSVGELLEADRRREVSADAPQGRCEARNGQPRVGDRQGRSIRHTFGSWLAIQGKPLRTIQELLGHADVRMTIRYAHLSPAHLREAVEGIEAAEKSNRLRDGCATEEKATTGNVAKSLDENWWPQRDSNPCRGLERAVS
jgi:Phage integrase family